MSRLFERNGTLKIISVFFAIVLWLYAVSELNPEISWTISNVPVTILNEDKLVKRDLILAYEPVDRTSIRVKGLTNDIRRINESAIKATLNLDNAKGPGTLQIPLNIEGLPRDVNLEKVPEITVIVNNLVSKEIPLDISIKGSLPSGYYLHPPAIEPTTLVLTGAESLLKNAVQGVVELDIRNSRGFIKKSLPIILKDAGGRTIAESKYITMEQDYAMISAQINPVKAVPVDPVITGKPAEGYEVTGVEIQPVQVTVNADASIIDSLVSIPTGIVDVQEAKRDVHMSIELKPPEGIHLDPGESDQVSVIVRIKERTIDKNITLSTDVGLLNIPEGLTAAVSPIGPVTINVKGLYSYVNPLNTRSIHLSADLSGLTEPGVYQIPIKADLPQGVEVKGLPGSVTVTLTAAEEVDGVDEPVDGSIEDSEPDSPNESP